MTWKIDRYFFVCLGLVMKELRKKKSPHQKPKFSFPVAENRVHSKTAKLTYFFSGGIERDQWN